MTTIIIDGQLKRVFTDSRATVSESKLEVSFFPPKLKVHHSSHYSTGARKVFAIEGALVVGTGSYRDVLFIKDALLFGRRLPKRLRCNNTNVYKVDRHDDFNLRITKYTNVVKRLFGISYSSKLAITETTLADNMFFVDGSGMRYAQGAIKQGADAAQAIKVAAALDCYTDDGVVSMPIPGYQQEEVS